MLRQLWPWMVFMRRLSLPLMTLLVFVMPLMAQTTPPLGHVVVVAFENHSYSSVVGNSAMPYLNSLISQYALANGFYANTHPSIGNYLELTTGQILTNDDAFNSTISVDNIERELLKSGKTWKSYAQSIPYAGYTGWDSYPYVQHHNPFAYFSDNRNGSGQQNNIVPFSQFTNDVANGTLPNFSFVTPDLKHDAHDCPDGSSNCTDGDMLWAADQFLQYQIAPILNSAQFQKDGLLVIWWDEASDSDTAYGGGHVAVTLIGPSVKRGFRSSNLYQHQSLLRTISEGLGITPAGGAASAPSMAEFFSSNGTSSGGTAPTSTTVTLQSPAPGASVGSPVTFSATATSPNGISGWVIYVDGGNAYQVDNYSNSLTKSLSLGTGTHSVMIRAWDSVSGYGSSPTFTINVGGTSTGPITPTSTTVIIQSPTANASVGSPVTFSALGSSPNGISGWVIYADDNNVYQANNGSNSLTASVNLAAGTHKIYIRAWDNVSGYGTSSTFYITVGSTTPTPVNTTTVNLLTPSAGATVGSPVTFSANGSSPNGISGWVIYADDNNVYQVNNGSTSMTTTVKLASGTHKIYVRAWDNVSGYGTSSTIYIAVP